MDASLNQAEETPSCSHCTATEAKVGKGMPSPEMVTSYKDNFLVHNQLNWEQRSLAGTNGGQTMQEAVPAPRRPLSRALLYGTLKMSSCSSSISSLSCLILSLTFHHKRAFIFRTGPVSPFSRGTVGFSEENVTLQLCGEQDRNTRWGSLLWTPAGASLPTRKRQAGGRGGCGRSCKL